MKLIHLLFIFFIPVAYADPVILCDVSKGLDLINRETYSAAQIEMILSSCDKVSPTNPSVLLLHGLWARKNKQASQAIEWLQKARTVAPQNQSIAMELATTYELIDQPTNAEQIYQSILASHPQHRPALLGLARIVRLEGNLGKAAAIYQGLLAKDSQDVDALNGFGWVKAAQNNLPAASYYFNETLKIQPQNSEALLALNKIKLTELQKLGPAQLCDAVNGLLLLSQENPPISQIKAILDHCASNKIENRDTYLLQGLLARNAAQNNKNYKAAIAWLQKAAKAAAKNDYNPDLELAITYEWAEKPQDAQLIYQHILAQEPTNRAAILGQARVLRSMKSFAAAREIYQRLLDKNSKDADALNGLGWIALAQGKLAVAIQFFQDVLKVQPMNKEALMGLNDSKKPKLPPEVVIVKLPVLCAADEGLILINQPNPPLNKIQDILTACDKNTPNETSALLLHGILARHFAQQTQNYTSAIRWLMKAIHTAVPGNDTPILELAITYEWAGDFKQALAIYQVVLAKSPDNKVALLGKARVLRFSYQIEPSLAIYHQLLEQSPNDAEVLNGMGEAYMANYEFGKARSTFNKILVSNPGNKQAAADLELLNQSTRNILDLSVGHYTVPPRESDGLNLYYFRNLNATDGLTVLGTHNTKQIESGFGAGSALLPNNSLLLGYQHVVPKQYGWQVSYDARQHKNLPFESRAFGSANLYLKRNLEWFGGLRLAFPSIWNTQLLISGFNVYTPLPVNVSVTGFWAFQEVGGYNSSYSLDFSKEYSSHLFYDFGPSYLVEQQSWEVHGRLIFPVFKNQAFVAQGSHYFFNRSTFVNAGWRVYWA